MSSGEVVRGYTTRMLRKYSCRMHVAVATKKKSHASTACA